MLARWQSGTVHRPVLSSLAMREAMAAAPRGLCLFALLFTIIFLARGLPGGGEASLVAPITPRRFLSG
jgi:hypothetical protein